MVSSWLQKIQTRQRKRKEKRKSLSVVLDVTAASSRPHDLDPTRQTREHPVRHRSAPARIRFQVIYLAMFVRTNQSVGARNFQFFQ
jgi:hypothetical protein